MRHLILTAVVGALAISLSADVALADKPSRSAKKAFELKYQGKKFRLRIPLRPSEPYVGAQYVDYEGAHFPNYKQPVMYEAIERVTIDSVGRSGDGFYIVVAREAGTSDRVVSDQVWEGFIKERQPAGDAINRAFRESLAIVGLRTGTAAKLLSDEEEVAAAEELLKKVFYIDSEPTREELLEFVRGHREYPVEALMEITGLSLEDIRGCLESQ